MSVEGNGRSAELAEGAKTPTRGSTATADAPPRNPGDAPLTAVRGAVVALLAELPVPPSSLRIRSGETVIELAWAPTEADPGTGASPAAVAAPYAAPERTAPAHPAHPAPPPTPAPPATSTASGDARDSGESAETSSDSADTLIGSPIVGHFYRAPEPGAPPFVEVGSEVAAGQQLGIVEAMKMMIPVEATCAGRVTRICRSDGDPVEYGEPLFAVAPNDS